MYDDLQLTPEERGRYLKQLHDFEERALPDVRRRRDALVGAGDDDAYDDVVDEESFVLGAIHTLRQALPRAGSISSEEAARADYVRLGSRVLVRYEDGTERRYIIGLTLYDLERPTPELAGTSWGSGVAKALLGRRTGDEAAVEAPTGRYTLRVLSVQQDAAYPPPRSYHA
jgi:transcription elongation factor GreA